ncbi:Thr rich extensin [Coprinopsis cinerea okayama7|uniref:Thr rich extensin n=1 Tax=Coprinopsis cinerea (strain Okayama-7 / 130 / ATCC MYA-4618 / FGSC 9003) TaxID=240176 RepID=A8NAZ2_COPC7|nr:Thr rich extensin [Coprinopsis cinerea okayama7\|eukprot:XP_001831994.1 Thr rich extensin [Coprinopsis cinerea okayama7\
MAPGKQPVRTWTEDQLKVLNNAKREFHTADNVKRQAVADAAATEIQAALEGAGERFDSKASQALFTAVRGWLKARCKAKRKADAITWKGVKARNVFIRHNRRSIKETQKALYEKATGDIFPYAVDTFVDTPLPALDEQDMAFLEENGMSPDDPELDAALGMDDDEDETDEEITSSDDDSDNDEDNSHGSAKKTKSGATSTRNRGGKKTKASEPTPFQKRSNQVFSYFQDAVSLLWKKLPAEEKRRYRLRAFINKQRGPTVEEQAEMADKELPAWLEGVAAQGQQKYNVRMVFTLVFLDRNGVMNIWTSDYNSNIGGTNFTDIHPRLFEDSGLNAAFGAWGRREFRQDNAPIKIISKRQGAHALINLPSGSDGARLVDPTKPPIPPVAKPWLMDLLRSYFTHKYVEACNAKERVKCPWADIEKGPSRFFDSDILPTDYQAMIREPSRMTVAELKAVLGYLYTRQESGIQPPFRFDYYIDKSSGTGNMVRSHQLSGQTPDRQQPIRAPVAGPVIKPASTPTPEPAVTTPRVKPAATKPMVNTATKPANSPAPDIDTAFEPPFVPAVTPPRINPATKPTVNTATKPIVNPATSPPVNMATKPAIPTSTKPTATPISKATPAPLTPITPSATLPDIEEEAEFEQHGSTDETLPSVAPFLEPPLPQPPILSARPKPRPRPSGTPWTPDKPRRSAAELVRALGGSPSKLHIQPPTPSAGPSSTKTVEPPSKKPARKRTREGIELLPLPTEGVTTRSRGGLNRRQTRSMK